MKQTSEIKTLKTNNKALKAAIDKIIDVDITCDAQEKLHNKIIEIIEKECGIICIM